MAQRIRIEVFPGNLDCRRFHVSTQVTSEKVISGVMGGTRQDPFHSSFFTDFVSGGRKEFTEDTKATLMKFYDIDGINSVGLDTFEITIARAPAYEWEEIHNEIIDTILEVTNWPDEGTTVDYLLGQKVYAEPIGAEIMEAEIMRYRQESRGDLRMFH